MYIVHTSTFSTLKIHNNCYDYQTGMKLAGIVELIALYQSSKCPILMFILYIMFYESLNVQNRMCELCMFSQIRTHIYYFYQQSYLSLKSKNVAKFCVHISPIFSCLVTYTFRSLNITEGIAVCL